MKMLPILRSFLVFALSLSAAPPEKLTVIYTGRTLGYARECEEEFLVPKPAGNYTMQKTFRNIKAGQTLPLTGYARECQTWSDPDSYPSKILSLITAARHGKSKSVTVGVGDHFSLDYRARTVTVKSEPGQPPRSVPIDELYFLPDKGWIIRSDFNDPVQFQAIINDSASGESTIDGDNVTSFLVRAGYDALVPGEHDFYNGPERVRQIGRLLEKSNRRLLGANLVIRGEQLNPDVTRPDALRERNFLTSHPAIEIDLPKAVLPWIRHFKLKSEQPYTVGAVKICRAENVDVACPEKVTFKLDLVSNNGRWSLPASYMQPLEAGQTYHLCVTSSPASPGIDPKDKNKLLCKAFTVEVPFFDGRRTTLRPYHVLADKDAVIFGVVALGLEKQIGKLNATWKHANPDPKKGEFEIRLETLDPLGAAHQMIEYCEALGDCTNRSRILLAQMPAEAAHGLQYHLEADRFDFVVTAASLTQHTPFAKAIYSSAHPPLIVSPRMPYHLNKPRQLDVHVQSVTLNRSSGGAVSRAHCLQPHTLAGNPTTIISNAVVKALSTLGLHANLRKPGSAFVDLVLEAMRRYSGASAAIIQKRDLFEVQSRLESTYPNLKYEPDILRAAVETIVWKGDFLIPRLIKGSALKQAVIRGKDLDKADTDIYSARTELRLGLHVLGIFEDTDAKKWTIDGAAIEDDKQYLVALSDYLAFGDTGYPELNQPVIGKPERAAELESAPRIATIVTELLLQAHGSQPVQPLKPNQTRFWSYFDYLTWVPASTPPPSGYFQQMADYFDGSRKGTPAFPGVEKRKLGASNETLVQVRNRWRLINEKNEFGVSLSRNNQPGQKDLLERFAGVQDSRVNTAENTTFTTAWAVELRREKRRSVDFLRSESKFQRQEIQNGSGRIVRTYPQNEFSLDGGWRMSFTPLIQQKRWNGIVLSGVWNTQFELPRIESSYIYPASSCPTGEPSNGKCTAYFDARIPRTSRFFVKLGLRRETRDSWWEAGLLSGVVRRAINYSFENSSSCDLREITLTKCLTNLEASAPISGKPAQFSAIGQNRENGLFFNFNWRIPLRPDSSIQLVLENRGRYYFRSTTDFTFDTRLNNLFSAGLSVPVAGKLALKPTWSLFHFANKFVASDKGNLYPWALTSHSLEMKLEYRFDWLIGQPFRKVLLYGGGPK